MDAVQARNELEILRAAVRRFEHETRALLELGLQGLADGRPHVMQDRAERALDAMAHLRRKV